MTAGIGAVLDPRAIRTTESAVDRLVAVHRCADVLEEIGAVERGYRPAMLERERLMSTWLGEGVAIPHGVDGSRALVRRDSLAVLRFPAGVPWDGGRVIVCVAIAVRGDGHLAVLSTLAGILLDPRRAAALRSSTDPAAIRAMLDPAEAVT